MKHSCRLQVIESILDDDNDMQDMYLGRRAALEVAMQAQQVMIAPSKDSNGGCSCVTMQLWLHALLVVNHSVIR